VYTGPGEQIRFGDVFEAEFLYDVHAAEDTRAIPMYELPAEVAVALGKKLQLPSKLEAGDLPLHSDKFPARAQQDYVRAHGRSTLAVIVSDNCTISDMFGYDRDRPRRSGRLIFAPVSPATPSELEQAMNQTNFDRFPLPPGVGFGGGIIDLRRIFMADKRALADTQRVVSLDKDMAEQLEIRWTAFTARRGPVAFNRNAIKLAGRLEGHELENAATAFDDDTPREPEVAALIKTLERIAAAAGSAADGLHAYATSERRSSD
jgi:hypothetical protein